MGILAVLALISTILSPVSMGVNVVVGGIDVADFVSNPPAVVQNILHPAPVQKVSVRHHVYRYAPSLNGGGSYGYNRDIGRKTD